jgi:hypothetical protein
MWLRSFLLVLILACGAGTTHTAPEFGSNTPQDLKALASETYSVFAAAVPRWAACVDGTVLNGAWELDDRGRYEPATGEITIRIPATAGQLEISIVHELAHHLEFVCPQDDEIRHAFTAAQGLDPEADWFDGATWESTPSEQWATAVVQYVLDRPDERARTPITAEAMEIVATWASEP